MVIDYKSAGVDVEAGYEAVKQMQSHVARTQNENLVRGLANFSGMLRLPDAGPDSVLVAGTDGVGTKLKLAFLLDRHDTVGIDCVAMCANDVLCQGAAPLLFLDYIATGKLEPDRAASLVAGVAEGCVQAGCVLLGGETAEMPGFYLDGEYDLAGFCVGHVKRDKIVDGSAIEEGDLLIGLSSSGAHSNGFSLLRNIFIHDDFDWESPREDLDGRSVADTLLTPTRIYVKPVLKLMEAVKVHGMAHITGGGFVENIPRMIPEGLRAEIALGSWKIPPILSLAVEEAELPLHSAYNTFNMGIGFVIAIPASEVEQALSLLAEAGETAQVIGRIGKRDVDGEAILLIPEGEA